MAPPLANIVPTVQSLVPLCPEPVIESHIRRAATRFCEDTLAWVETLSAAQVVAADFPYVVPAGAGRSVSRILSVAIDGMAPPLDASSVDYEERHANNWLGATGVPDRFVEAPIGILHLVPLPNLSTSMAVTVALEPSSTGTEIGDDVYVKHWETIMSGAVVLLSIIPGVPWSSGEMAAVHGTLYDLGVAKAKVHAHLHRRLPQLSTSPAAL